MAEQSDNLQQRLFATGQMGGQAQAPDANQVPKDLSDFINQLFDKTGSWLSKATGINVASLFNTGVVKHFDFQQAALPGAKEIGAGLPIHARGGALAAVAGQLINQEGGALQNWADGVGGSAQGEGGSYGDSGSGGGASSFDHVPIGPLPTGEAMFASMDMPMSMLGNFERPITPSTGMSGLGAGMEIG